MGDVISMAERRSVRRLRVASHGSQEAVVFAFDLASPFTYLAAERVERMFETVQWRAVAAPATMNPGLSPALRARIHERAAELRMPLVWPEHEPVPAGAASRVAAFAEQQGRAGAFVLAATRLAYCGGFDLDDVEILAEAAAAAGLPLADCMSAASDRDRGKQLELEGQRLAGCGADRLPVVIVGSRMFAGEERLPEAAAASRLRPLGRTAPS